MDISKVNLEIIYLYSKNSNCSNFSLHISCPSLCTRPILEIVHSIKNKIAPILFLLEKNLHLSLCAQYARTKIGGILFFNLNEFEFDLTKEWIWLRKKDFELEHSDTFVYLREILLKTILILTNVFITCRFIIAASKEWHNIQL